MFDKLLKNIDIIKRTIVFDYAFIKAVIKISSLPWDENRVEAMNLLDEIKNDWRTIDCFGNEIDLRFVEHNRELNEDNFKIIESVLKEYEFILVARNKLKINDKETLTINIEDLKSIMALLLKGKNIKLIQNETANDIKMFWKQKLKTLPNIIHKWLIIQEPFLFNTAYHLENVIEFLRNIKAKKYLIITRKGKNNETKRTQLISFLNESSITYELFEYEEEKKGKKKVHNRFILTNNILIISQNSFGYYDPAKNRVVDDETLKVSTILNDFDTIRKELFKVKKLYNLN